MKELNDNRSLNNAVSLGFSNASDSRVIKMSFLACCTCSFCLLSDIFSCACTGKDAQALSAYIVDIVANRFFQDMRGILFFNKNYGVGSPREAGDAAFAVV